MKNIVWTLSVVALVSIGSYAFSCSSFFSGSQLPSGNTTTSNSQKSADDAPEIITTGAWLNTDEDLSLEKLRGSVVMIEFWTFGCYNCTNTIPHLNQWYKEYHSQGFEIIGIHCPEFDNERDLNNVKENVKQLEIQYPVLIDNKFTNWYKYDVHAWPTIFLIDKEGVIRYKKVGEKGYGETEKMIETLLAENPKVDSKIEKKIY